MTSPFCRASLGDLIQGVRSVAARSSRTVGDAAESRCSSPATLSRPGMIPRQVTCQRIARVTPLFRQPSVLISGEGGFVTHGSLVGSGTLPGPNARTGFCACEGKNVGAVRAG